MTLLNFIVKCMKTLHVFTFLTLECVYDPTMKICVSEMIDNDGHILYHHYRLKYRHGDAVPVTMDWNEQSFWADGGLEESDLSEWYKAMREFEAKTGVDMLSEDWHLCEQDSGRVSGQIHALTEILYDPRREKEGSNEQTD